GVNAAAEQIGRSIRDYLPKVASEFLQRQPYIIVSTKHPNNQVWASMLTGPEGFVRALDEQTVQIDALPVEHDPLRDYLYSVKEIGLLAIEHKTRRRMRINGTATVSPEGSIQVQTEQVYANCPKYIQAREHSAAYLAQRQTKQAVSGGTLNVSQQEWIRKADTFFIASISPGKKADASHRGGTPGFVQG